MMTRCNTYTRMMMRFFDRTLGEEETAALRRHIGECARCREQFDRLSAALGSLEHATGAEPPASLDVSVMRAVRALPVPVPAHTGLAPVFAAAGVLLALAVAGAVQGAGAVDLALAAADTLNGIAAGAWKTQLAVDFIGGLFPGLAGAASRMFWNVVVAGAVCSMLVGLRSAVAVRRKA
jgi:anti-sigma factor RsiW